MNYYFIMLVVTGYIIGSIPTGYIIAKAYGVDIRAAGSGNIGTTNLTRVMGKRFGILTLLGDGIKALAFMIISKKLLGYLHVYAYYGHTLPLCLIAFFVLIGNCYSVFLGFSGGKGGVTTFAIFLSLTPLCALLSIFTYVLVGKMVNISAAGTLSSVALLPIYIYSFFPSGDGHERMHYSMLAFIFSIVVFNRHKRNIKEMLT